MGAGAASALAETVTSIATLRGSSFRRPGAVLWSLNSLPFAVHIRTIVGAIHLAWARLRGARCIWRSRRGRGLSL
jgi:hypothetical protein